MYECVKKLFSQRQIGVTLARKFVKYAEEQNLNVKINNKIVELQSLKNVLKFYMGYIDCDDKKLAERMKGNNETKYLKKKLFVR